MERFVTIALDDIYQEYQDTQQNQFYNLIQQGVEAFDCSKSPYHTEFLKTKALDACNHNTSRTYLIVDTEQLISISFSNINYSKVIAAYFTLGLSSIDIKLDVLSRKNKKTIY